MSDRIDNVKARARVTVTLEVDVACVWADHSLRDVFDAAAKQALARALEAVDAGGAHRVTIVDTAVEAVITKSENREP